MNGRTPQQPRYMPVESDGRLAVFIHGITEGPDQFAPLMAEANAAGYSAVSLLLPGHGGSATDFARTNEQEWTAYVRTRLEQARERYGHIVLVGHSMGTLLSFLAYAERPQNIVGIVAIASPLVVRVRRRAVRNLLRAGLGRQLSPDDPAASVAQASSVAQGPALGYVAWLPRLADLFRLIARTRKVLKEVSVPTLVVHADGDELVGAASLRIFRRKVPARYLDIARLPHSTHFTYDETDRLTLHRLFRDFLAARR